MLSGEITLNNLLRNKLVLYLAEVPKKDNTCLICSFDQKRKGGPYKARMNRLKSHKSINMLLSKVIRWKLFSTTATRFFQPPAHSANGENSHEYLLTITFQCSTLSKLNKFSHCRKRCAATVKPNSLFMTLQSLQFILFGVQKMIFYQILVKISNRLFPLMALCTSLMRRTSWPKLIFIVVLLSTLKLLQKSDRSTENGFTFPDPVKNPRALTVTINITVFFSSVTLISFWTHTTYGTWSSSSYVTQTY